MPMTQAPTTFRSILLPGVLARAAVVLALGLLFLGPCRPAAADSLPALAPARESPRTSTDGLAGEPVSPAFCRHGSLPSGEAVRHDHATHRGLASRHAQPGVLLVSRGGTPGIELPDRLALFPGRLPAAARPALHVLFCTWLA
jgi:hypothetical protein